jgi:hypothetical protein
MQKPSISKGGLSDHDFASLASGFESTPVGSGMDIMDDDFDIPEAKTNVDLYQEIYGDD